MAATSNAAAMRLRERITRFREAYALAVRGDYAHSLRVLDGGAVYDVAVGNALRRAMHYLLTLQPRRPRYCRFQLPPFEPFGDVTAAARRHGGDGALRYRYARLHVDELSRRGTTTTTTTTAAGAGAANNRGSAGSARRQQHHHRRHHRHRHPRQHDDAEDAEGGDGSRRRQQHQTKSACLDGDNNNNHHHNNSSNDNKNNGAEGACRRCSECTRCGVPGCDDNAQQQQEEEGRRRECNEAAVSHRNTDASSRSRSNSSYSRSRSRSHSSTTFIRFDFDSSQSIIAVDDNVRGGHEQVSGAGVAATATTSAPVAPSPLPSTLPHGDEQQQQQRQQRRQEEEEQQQQQQQSQPPLSLDDKACCADVNVCDAQPPSQSPPLRDVNKNTKTTSEATATRGAAAAATTTAQPQQQQPQPCTQPLLSPPAATTAVATAATTAAAAAAVVAITPSSAALHDAMLTTLPRVLTDHRGETWFRVPQVIGSGAFAHVYKIVSARGNMMAIKCIRLGASDVCVDDVAREVNIGCRLFDEHIVNYTDWALVRPASPWSTTTTTTTTTTAATVMMTGGAAVTQGAPAASSAAAAAATTTTTPSAATTSPPLSASPLSVVQQAAQPTLTSSSSSSSSSSSWLVIFMEFMAGGSLRAVLDAFPRGLALPLARRYVLDMLKGLAYLHAHNIVHADVKPQNVLLSAAGRCKVSDFGSCVTKANVTRCSGDVFQLRGTALYMSVEVASGAAPTMRSDVWSVGVTLYEMLTGNLPWCWCLQRQRPMQTPRCVSGRGGGGDDDDDVVVAVVAPPPTTTTTTTTAARRDGGGGGHVHETTSIEHDAAVATVAVVADNDKNNGNHSKAHTLSPASWHVTASAAAASPGAATGVVVGERVRGVSDVRFLQGLANGSIVAHVTAQELPSPEAYDFIARCLHTDPLQRPSVMELLEHPFFWS